MRVALVLACLIFTGGGESGAADYYGAFEGTPQCNFIRGDERPFCVVTNDFTFVDPNGLQWTVPAGELSDGASIPRWAWSIVGGPFDGNYLFSALVHDYYCCTKHRNFDDTHEAFWRGMVVEGVNPILATMMKVAVYLGGPKRWEVVAGTTAPAPCKPVDEDGRPLYSSKFDELSDRQRRMVIAKYAAISRTLVTTDGVALDIVGNEVIPASGPQAIAHLNELAGAVESKFNYPSLERLGLFADPAIEVEAIQFADGRPSRSRYNFKDGGVWKQGQIPALDEFMAKNNLRFLPMAADVPPRIITNPFEGNLGSIPSEWLQ